MRAFFTVILISSTLIGCGGDPGYCAGEVRAEDQDQGITDGGFFNPDLVGVDICDGNKVGRGFCADVDATFGPVNKYPRLEDFCLDEGYTVECNDYLWVKNEADCPAIAD